MGIECIIAKKRIMKKILYLITCIMVTVACTKDRVVSSNKIVASASSELIYYWNFNTISGTVTSTNPDYSLIASTAKITYPGTGTGYLDKLDLGYTNNLRNDANPVTGLRARNPSNTRDVVVAMPTTGFKNAIVQFATARSGSGATVQNRSEERRVGKECW